MKPAGEQVLRAFLLENSNTIHFNMLNFKCVGNFAER
jgi:hypothetical protein